MFSNTPTPPPPRPHLLQNLKRTDRPLLSVVSEIALELTSSLFSSQTLALCAFFGEGRCSLSAGRRLQKCLRTTRFVKCIHMVGAIPCVVRQWAVGRWGSRCCCLISVSPLCQLDEYHTHSVPRSPYLEFHSYDNSYSYKRGFFFACGNNDYSRQFETPLRWGTTTSPTPPPPPVRFVSNDKGGMTWVADLVHSSRH